MTAHEADMKNAALTEAQLYNHNLTELQQQAHNHESQLREELRTQTELIRELRHKMEASTRGNFEPAGGQPETLFGKLGDENLFGCFIPLFSILFLHLFQIFPNLTSKGRILRR